MNFNSATCLSCTLRNSRRVEPSVPKHSGSAPSILFVAEAPGRLGAHKTGVPLLGDATARRFEGLLASVGLSRFDVAITNAVLCTPLDAAGRNRAPTAREIRACAKRLAATIDEVAPALVVALGATALCGLGSIEQHDMSVARHAGEVREWYGRRLGVMYHPGPRARAHRNDVAQVADLKSIFLHAAALGSGAR